MESTQEGIRKAAVAGTFYPANPAELTRTIAGFFSEVEKVPLAGKPVGIIAPHAGYPYSGKTAAKAFKLLEGEDYDTVVIISPSHTVFFQGCSVFDGIGYETPLGVVDIDQDMAKRLANIGPAVYFSKMGHAVGNVRGEHALEVQLPFLQICLGKFKLVPIVMGDQDENSIRALGEALAAVLKDTNTLMVASTDLSHFHPEKRARKLDFAVQEAIEKFDEDMLLETIEDGRGEACGAGPVAAIMLAAKRMGAREVRFLDYTTSGATTGDFSEVVGYLSAAIVAPADAHPQVSERELMGSRRAELRKAKTLPPEAKQQLLDIARKAVAAKLTGDKLQPRPIEALEDQKGMFVTLKIDGHLRGCIGQIRARQPLYQTVAEMAVAAAFDDPRFPPLKTEEAERVEFEISVLSPLERLRDFSKVEIGRDGLMIKLDLHSGLLLPQVATENHWTVKEFLEQTCLKAGLPKESYKDKFAEVYKFSAEVF
ncbi:MAG: AmmeMemoRadiSam system protein B [candidate division Zixibacteria bacterium]|nr:AmmeMemoRadiSam system protein B [candidate division Zixibacteria bacterium]